MILFCDTSALVKLYVKEESSDEMCAAAEKAKAIAVSRISWAETMATLARRVRECPSDAGAIETVRARFQNNWSSFAIVEVTQPLVELAGDYADTFALRAYDGVQLAAARMLQAETDGAFCFACFDLRLQKAASVLGMQSLAQIA